MLIASRTPDGAGAEPTEASHETQSVGRTPRGGAARAALAAGVALALILAGAGWYAVSSHDSGLAQLTPGSRASGAVTAAQTPSAAKLPVTQISSAEPGASPAATPTPTTTP